ncbi:MAG: class II glutamine amidotransferase, partial [Candidatus Bathyarchaeia archaeon]
MLQALRHRGIDSTGITVAGQPNESDLTIRLWVDERTDPKNAFDTVDKEIGALGGKVLLRDATDAYLKLHLDYKGEVSQLARRLLNVDGVVIHSIGRSSELIKDVGDANRLDDKHKVSSLLGTHGIGHVRLATESQVDISHSHPYWAYPYPDITLVHNGQLTNYHNLKRSLIQKGHRFLTHNDSEVIAVYLADQLAQGTSLDKALHNSLRDLDGTFTYVVSTPNGMGMAKDKW